MPAGLLRFVTAGSVDDGKSTLIGRLLHDGKGLLEDQLTAVQAASRRRGLVDLDLSLVTDGLVAEREQGITIDVAYRYFATPARKFVIGDTPGHTQYTRNMVTAASSADAAVLLVDATHGPTTQTRRHALLASWLGVPHVVLAVNKMDRVGHSEAVFATIRDEFGRFAAGLGFAGLHAIPMSALHGDMVVDRGRAFDWYDGPTLLGWLETVPARADLHAASRDPLRLPVQRVARWRERPQDDEQRGWQGTVESGSISVGDDVVVLPAGVAARVARLLGPDGELREAVAGRPVTVLLDRPVDASRGDLIVAARARPVLSARIAADLCWFDAEPLVHGRLYWLKHGSRTVRARVDEVDWRLDVDDLSRRPSGDAPVATNDVVRVRLQVQQALPFEPFEGRRASGTFVLIDPSTTRTVAAGTVARLHDAAGVATPVAA